MSDKSEIDEARTAGFSGGFAAASAAPMITELRLRIERLEAQVLGMQTTPTRQPHVTPEVVWRRINEAHAAGCLEGFTEGFAAGRVIRQEDARINEMRAFKLQ